MSIGKMAEQDPNKLTALDWMGLVTIGAEAFLLGFSRIYSSSFIETFSEFGGEIPLLTQIVVAPLYGAICAVTLLLFGSAMWWPSLRRRPSTKRMLLVLGFVLGLGAIGLYVIGLYLPIFQVADLVSQ